LNANIIGNFNTATGYYAAYSNNIGTHNTATGFRALDSNTTGNYNTAQGPLPLSLLPVEATTAHLDTTQVR
jgi:trimeric autotransporter adhesin